MPGDKAGPNPGLFQSTFLFHTDIFLLTFWNKICTHGFAFTWPTYLYDSPALHALQTYVGGDYVADPELVDTLAKSAPESAAFLADLGTDWNSLFAGMGATWRRTHGIG